MIKFKFAIVSFLFLVSFSSQSQQKPEIKKIKVTGSIFEKSNNAPLEYATVTLINTANPKQVFGGLTNNKGQFDVEATPGTYTIKFEFISFKPFEISQKAIKDNTNLGVIALDEDATQLQEIVVRSEKTTVDIKLDKKVYNVGKDLMVKGGTVSDVLDNIPSVSVDVEGNISLRGNENVKILIDGRPSNAINITDALRMIPADAIDKVEVVTNPSARYDAEGGAGLLNIILKKGKTNGINGTFIATTGYPDNHGLSASLNLKSNKYNLFTNQAYNYRSNPGNAQVTNNYLNDDNSISKIIFEDRDNKRINKGYNGNFGADWYLDKSTTWTNAINYRKSQGDNEDNVTSTNFDSNRVYEFTGIRINNENSESENIEFTTNFAKKFKRDGHKLTIDGSFSRNKDNNLASITGTSNNTSFASLDNTKNNQDQKYRLLQVDYVLPFNKVNQLEGGYRGSFIDLTTDYQVINNGIINPNFTNILEYKEKVNAAYVQFGTKINKLSMLYGLRFEDSNIDINQLSSNIYVNKRYNNFFPSAFFTYEIDSKTNLSLSYSKRINRPRGRQINPFNSYSSNINIFQGNPDLNPSLTDAIDFGFLKRWEKLTLSTSLYYNTTNNSFQMIRYESGEFVITPLDAPDVIVNGQVIQVNGRPDIITPVLISTPVNLATEYRTGFEFTLNYSPYKWWKLNGNFNFFAIETKGIYTYTNFQNNQIVQDFANKTNSWFSRLTSKITFPNKIDWQTNATYNAPQTNAQGKSLGVFAMNLAFSKDVLKDKATLALNVNDVFNSRKRIMETNIPGSLDSYAEMQWRERQVTLSFTYRFNKQKSEREKTPRRDMDNEGGGDF